MGGFRFRYNALYRRGIKRRWNEKFKKNLKLNTDKSVEAQSNTQTQRLEKTKWKSIINCQKA